MQIQWSTEQGRETISSGVRRSRVKVKVDLAKVAGAEVWRPIADAYHTTPSWVEYATLCIESRGKNEIKLQLQYLILCIQCHVSDTCYRCP